MIEIVERARSHAYRTAIMDEENPRTYIDLLDRSEEIAVALLQGKNDLNEARIAFMITPGFDYVAVQWGIWRAGGIAVPLGIMHPVPELQYALQLTRASILIADEDHFSKGLLAAENLIPVWQDDKIGHRRGDLPDVDPDRGAMILFTSGTTSRPKGVVSTHNNINNQISCLIEAWEWSRDDSILEVLPLHHTHGIINVLSCALWAGAKIDFLPKFEVNAVWDKIRSGAFTLFMAVPTIYRKLVQEWQKFSGIDQENCLEACSGFRLMVSGSAALPVSVLKEWEVISGQRLLERYGMTEIGMALSNPYHHERRTGTVGQPLPRVEIELRDEAGKPVGVGEQGEIHVKGPNVFREYWENPEATKAAFTEDGWFRTGDMAVLEDGYYRILGRSSVDIIKSGGYKISALEIEEVLRRLEGVHEIAVVGLPDDEYGEQVAAAIVAEEHARDPERISAFAAEFLAPYKIPRTYKFVDELPLNALGKVVKPQVKQLFEI